jgi:hypothetical protein
LDAAFVPATSFDDDDLGRVLACLPGRVHVHCVYPPHFGCKACDPGTFVDDAKATECKPCPKDTYSGEGAASCKPCSPGTSAAAGSAECSVTAPVEPLPIVLGVASVAAVVGLVSFFVCYARRGHRSSSSLSELSPIAQEDVEGGGSYGTGTAAA